MAAYDTWRNIRHELERMHLVTLATADGQVAHTDRGAIKREAGLDGK